MGLSITQTPVVRRPFPAGSDPATLRDAPRGTVLYRRPPEPLEEKLKRAIVGLLVAAATVAVFVSPAEAATGSGVEHLHFAAGPYTVTPGANLILTDYHNVPKPNVNGFMTRVAPNLRYALPNGQCCGKVPRVDVLHLHHGVWLTNGTAGAGEGNGFCLGRRFCLYPFMATGEEKTIYSLPKGYGYPIGGNDRWFVNYMIHNLWPQPAKVYITYDMDFIPDSSPAARGITPVHPIWMDVEDHHIYPVFDVHRYSGRNGIFTFPDMAKKPYAGGPPLNMFTVDHPGTLVATAGHVHPGGLYTDLDLIRSGASIARKAVRGSVPDSVRLFQSNAHYFDKRGPISWDMAMTGTAKDWRPHVDPGDTMRVSATYETRRASWYESMGIMVVWEAWDDQIGLDPFTGKVHRAIAHQTSGINPFRHAVDQQGFVTHGHLAENNHHGGTTWTTVKISKLHNCRTKTVDIAGFVYSPGDIDTSAPGTRRCIPTIPEGQSITFVNQDASSLSAGAPGFDPSQAYRNSIFHSITACQNPCGLNTGISYPLANGAGGYDSGQLGNGTPAVGRLDWSTPTTLKPGVYTYFCRIHPFMRGVFRVVG
jgi:plastocyanin